MIIFALRTVATYVAVSLYVLLAGPPGMLLAILFGWKDLLYFLVLRDVTVLYKQTVLGIAWAGSHSGG